MKIIMNWKSQRTILEYLAVKALKGKDMRRPILCLSSHQELERHLKTIARPPDEFIRSVWRYRDEAEIRGHRRTMLVPCQTRDSP